MDVNGVYKPTYKYNNYTVYWFMVDISILTMVFLNQRSRLTGAPPPVGYTTWEIAMDQPNQHHLANCWVYWGI